MKNIQFLVMDVDGTLTDGKIIIGNNGELCKAFNTKDGCGLQELLPPSGIIPAIITGRTSEILMNRCRELGIKSENIYQGVGEKTEKLRLITDDFSKVAYIGDDYNDLSVMLAVKAAGGLVGCPKDSCKQVLPVADFISEKNGGEGAVREFIEYILEI